MFSEGEEKVVRRICLVLARRFCYPCSICREANNDGYCATEKDKAECWYQVLKDAIADGRLK